MESPARPDRDQAEDRDHSQISDFVSNTDRRWWHGIGERPRNIRLVLVTVEMATEWMTRNVCNRNIRKGRVALYARQMAEGLWELNGETLVFDVQGRLVNGQHRLSAIILSRTAIWMIAVFDVGLRAFSTTDAGMPRLCQDILGIAGETNAATLSAILAVVWHLKTNRMNLVWGGNNSASSQEKSELLGKVPEVKNSIPVANNIKGLCPPSAAGACHWVFSLIDQSAAARFFEYLISGAGLIDGDPILSLRNRLILTRTGRPQGRNSSRINKQEATALIIKTWNLWRTGEKKKLMIWKSTEPFPAPVEGWPFELPES